MLDQEEWKGDRGERRGRQTNELARPIRKFINELRTLQIDIVLMCYR